MVGLLTIDRDVLNIILRFLIQSLGKPKPSLQFKDPHDEDTLHKSLDLSTSAQLSQYATICKALQPLIESRTFSFIRMTIDRIDEAKDIINPQRAFYVRAIDIAYPRFRIEIPLFERDKEAGLVGFPRDISRTRAGRRSNGLSDTLNIGLKYDRRRCQELTGRVFDLLASLGDNLCNIVSLGMGMTITGPVNVSRREIRQYLSSEAPSLELRHVNFVKQLALGQAGWSGPEIAANEAQRAIKALPSLTKLAYFEDNRPGASFKTGNGHYMPLVLEALPVRVDEVYWQHLYEIKTTNADGSDVDDDPRLTIVKEHALHALALASRKLKILSLWGHIPRSFYQSMVQHPEGVLAHYPNLEKLSITSTYHRRSFDELEEDIIQDSLRAMTAMPKLVEARVTFGDQLRRSRHPVSSSGVEDQFTFRFPSESASAIHLVRGRSVRNYYDPVIMELLKENAEIRGVSFHGRLVRDIQASDILLS
ncbi:hypothetical protein F4860DRAFT_510836 [Xylaria cubensis]|nr:hypothetical protein F4860DRAFT_510836 [Xylaria cubensis]